MGLPIAKAGTTSGFSGQAVSRFTEFFFLNWAAMALSLTNIILLGWLALTVLLNADRRHWRTWMAGGGLLVGCAFFVSHTAILALSLNSVGIWLNRWWRLGWLPLTAAPLAWYGMILWYIDFWGTDLALAPTTSTNRRRQTWGIVVSSALFLVLMTLLLFFSSLPSFVETTQLHFSTTWTIGGFPVLLLIFPPYIVLCIALSLDALYHPTPSERLMGEQARQRARPWLIAATALLLLVSVVVVGVIVWVLFFAKPWYVAIRGLTMSIPMARFDVLLSSLIVLAVIMVGQAIISYEIFTGQTLPRGELRRSWINAIVLAIGFGVVVGLSFALQMPITALLLATLLMTFFYALLNWRSYARRQEYIRQLRPFVGSQHLYEQLLTPPNAPHAFAAPTDSASTESLPESFDAEALFHTLCTDVLGATQAQLLALGALAPLVEPPLSFPPNREKGLTNTRLAEIVDIKAIAPQTICVPLASTMSGGYVWAVPLWSERGLIGIFLLGTKQDNGLYTQEEMEIARVSGERLIDTQASAEIARRLMTLQRQQLTESQLLDRRARRILHDDVLPQIHAALLSLSRAIQDDSDQKMDGQTESNQEATMLLTDAHRQISNLLREMPARTMPKLAQLGLIPTLQQLVLDELKSAFDDVVWEIDQTAAQAARALSPLTAEVIFYAAREAMRNAARHGRGTALDRPLHLRVTLTCANGLQLQIQDDGVGTNEASANPGTGHGLVLHSTLLAIVGGLLEIASEPDKYTCVTIRLPHSLA